MQSTEPFRLSPFLGVPIVKHPVRHSSISLPDAKVGRRAAADSFEDAVKLRERLKTDAKGNLTHAQIVILQLLHRLGDADAGKVT